MWNREHVLTGRGLARRLLRARTAHVEMTSSALCLFFYTLRNVYTISHTAQTEMCADFKSEWRGTKNISQCSQSECSCTKNLFREHFPGYVYREHIWTGPKYLLQKCRHIHSNTQSSTNIHIHTWLKSKLSFKLSLLPWKLVCNSLNMMPLWYLYQIIHTFLETWFPSVIEKQPQLVC